MNYAFAKLVVAWLYCLGKLRRLRQANVYVKPCERLNCTYTQGVEVNKGSDQVFEFKANRVHLAVHLCLTICMQVASFVIC